MFLSYTSVGLCRARRAVFSRVRVTIFSQSVLQTNHQQDFDGDMDDGTGSRSSRSNLKVTYCTFPLSQAVQADAFLNFFLVLLFTRSVLHSNEREGKGEGEYKSYCVREYI